MWCGDYTLPTARWGLNVLRYVVIASCATVGMLVGGFSDIGDRRWALLACTVWFSCAEAISAMAPNPEIFGLFRFLAGVGLGGVRPAAIAQTVVRAAGPKAVL